jgi:SAM-dependent methyltransferase
MVKPGTTPEQLRFIRYVHKLGDYPLAYSSLRKMMGGDRYRQDFLRQAIGEGYASARILDVGCGPGQMAELLTDAERYVGVDVSWDYVRHARANAAKNNLENAEFMQGDITSTDFRELGEFDCVIAMGVLHHLRDSGVERMLERAIPALSDVGKVATADVARVSGAHWSANFMINSDRGSYVRDPQGYMDLMTTYFEEVHGEEMTGGLRVPITGADFPQFVTVSSGPIETAG